MEKLLAAWSLKTIQEAVNINRHLLNNGKSWKNVETYLPEAAKQIRFARGKRNTRRPMFRPCPECGRPMQLYPVNSDSQGRDRVGTTHFEDPEGREYKSMWLCGTTCSGRGCLYEEYNLYSVEQYKEGNL